MKNYTILDKFTKVPEFPDFTETVSTLPANPDWSAPELDPPLEDDVWSAKGFSFHFIIFSSNQSFFLYCQ